MSMSSSSRNRGRLAGLGLAVWALASGALGQELELPLSPSPVGSGARAAGMADAFVAIADDATAASWNPAGLVQLERPELSIVGSYYGIDERFDSALIGFDSRHDDGQADLNYLSVVWPLPVLVLGGRNVSVALNYQQKYDFTRSFDTTFLRATGGQSPTASRIRYRFEQEGSLSTVTPAVAIELNKRLSIGVALNLWRSTPFSDNSWTQKTRREQVLVTGPNVLLSNARNEVRFEDLEGENWVLGVLWNVTDRWSLAARYDTAWEGDVDFWRRAPRLTNRFASADSAAFGTSLSPLAQREKRTVHFPDTVALGVAWRRDDRLTLSLDVTRTDWSDFYMREASGRKTSLIDATDLRAFWDRSDFPATYTVRFGAEYVMIPKVLEEELPRLWTLRGGLFYDQEAAEGDPDDFYGAAIGVGLLLNHRVNIDAAYQIRYGDGVNRDFFRGVPGFREDVLQHRILLSTVIYF